MYSYPEGQTLCPFRPQRTSFDKCRIKSCSRHWKPFSLWKNYQFKIVCVQIILADIIFVHCTALGIWLSLKIHATERIMNPCKKYETKSPW